MAVAAKSLEAFLVEQGTISETILEKARERQRGEEAMRLLADIEASYDGRNDDLTEEQVEELANRAAHGIFDELAAEGKLRFARDRSEP